MHTVIAPLIMSESLSPVPTLSAAHTSSRRNWHAIMVYQLTWTMYCATRSDVVINHHLALARTSLTIGFVHHVCNLSGPPKRFYGPSIYFQYQT